MMHRRGTTGLVLVTLSVVIGIIALGVLAPSRIEAKPIKAVSSISNRVAVDTKNCEDDGGEIDVAYSYENDTLVGATTTCNGGYFDGVICVHDQTTIECYKRPSLSQTPEPFFPPMPETADPGQNPRTGSTILEENTSSSGGAAEDPPQGEEVVSSSLATTDDVVLACESLGGMATVITNGSIATTEIHCRGGVLGGSTCVVGHYDTSCTFFRVTTDVTFTDGTTPNSLADVLQNVDGSGKVVVMNQSGDNVENVKNQAAACRALGGVSDPNYDFDPDGTVGFSDATCKGGLLNGLYCFNTPSENVCIFMRAALPESVQVEPSEGSGVLVENAPVAPSPTVMPTEVVVANPTPTVESTALPTTEPTVAPSEPVDPPTFPTPPTDDVVAPPGEAEDPVIEPTPTVIVLT